MFLGWEEADQDKALAYLRYQARLCPTCRTGKEEWQRDRDAYVGHIEQCPGCERLEQERENAGNSKAKGLHIGLVPKEFATTDEELFGG